MKIVNKTNNPCRYSTDSGGSADCGTIAPGDSTYIPYSQPVNVYLSPADGSFTVKGMPASSTVTISTVVTD